MRLKRKKEVKRKNKSGIFNKKDYIGSNDNSGKAIIGDKLPFSASEAYKLLRTNLDFSITNEKECKMFGFISALPGEGKTTTAINTAYTIAENGQSVLLIEGDLRLPSISKKINVQPRPGLSNCLVGNAELGAAIHPSKLNPKFDIMPAGDLPPNPAELLDSKQMKSLLQTLADTYDTIIVDLPPIGIVTDGLILTKMLDGVILVVKENYCEKGALADTVRKLEFTDAKILGFVLNGAGGSGKDSYGKYDKCGKYGKYGK